MKLGLFFLYIVVKVLAYIGWCRGPRVALLAPEGTKTPLRPHPFDSKATCQNFMQP
jgi:hypothetical protein